MCAVSRRRDMVAHFKWLLTHPSFRDRPVGGRTRYISVPLACVLAARIALRAESCWSNVKTQCWWIGTVGHEAQNKWCGGQVKNPQPLEALQLTPGSRGSQSTAVHPEAKRRSVSMQPKTGPEVHTSADKANHGCMTWLGRAPVDWEVWSCAHWYNA